MKDIRPDLRERLEAIGREMTGVRTRLSDLEQEEGALKSLLQREEARFGKLEQSLFHTNGGNVDSVTGGTPLAKMIVNTIKQAQRPVTLEEFKERAGMIGYDFGAKKPGRVLHWALVAMNENNIIERAGDGWKLKEVTQ